MMSKGHRLGLYDERGGEDLGLDCGRGEHSQTADEKGTKKKERGRNKEEIVVKPRRRTQKLLILVHIKTVTETSCHCPVLNIDLA